MNVWPSGQGWEIHCALKQLRTSELMDQEFNQDEVDFGKLSVKMEHLNPNPYLITVNS